MERSEWRKLIYDSYMTNIYGSGHTNKTHFESQYKYFRRNYLKFMPNDQNAKILELGAGIGQFYYFCEKEGYHNYTGIDMSSENVAYIKEKISAEADIHKIDMFEYISAANDNSYDVIVLNDVIEHLTKGEIFDLLISVRRILKDGGIFLIKTPNMANPFVNTAGRYIGFDHEIGFTETSIKEVIRACGYSGVKVIGTDIYVFNPLISILAKPNPYYV